MSSNEGDRLETHGFIDRVISGCLRNKLVVVLGVVLAIGWGLRVAPFDWDLQWLPRDPVPVDAIPDIGENQQIVFTRWGGRSPQDVEDQVTYPLTVAMLGIPGVKTVRSYSMFGFSTIYIIFEEDIEFYWSRSRVLERLSSLPADALPGGVQPMLGPDATALGQVFWYTLEGRDAQGNPTGGWDLQELRSIQDWQVRYKLLAAQGISEVASIGGFVPEYQVDVDPDALRVYGLTLNDVFRAVKQSNIDVGARTVEINRAEYVIRGLGFIKDIADIEETVIAVNDNVPVYVRNVATVMRGPAERRGVLDKGGTEVVGGVAVVRYGENPLAGINNLKEQIAASAPGMPEKIVVDFSAVSAEEVRAFAEAQGFDAYAGSVLDQEAWLRWYRLSSKAERPEWVTWSKVTVVPFYDRSGLIYETLGTLKTALTDQILVTIIVILVMVMHLRSSMIISATLPLAVLLCFVAMKLFGVDANIVALSGIAIAIGTIVDMGVIVCETILRQLDEAPEGSSPLAVVQRATSEVGGAVTTAILTTVVSFLPVFTMIGAEGKLFRPLAFTKTFVLFASVMVALMVVPAIAQLLFTGRIRREMPRRVIYGALIVLGVAMGIWWSWLVGAIVIGIGVWQLVEKRLTEAHRRRILPISNLLIALAVGMLLTVHWLPLGPQAGLIANAIIVLAPIAALLLFFQLFMRVYEPILRWFLAHKWIFCTGPVLLVLLGLMIWLGAGALFGWLPEPIRKSSAYSALYHAFPGLPSEFMPDLDEGAFLYMPTTMPHASIGEAYEVLQLQDMAFAAIPEVREAVGKLGRADTPLDPAPVSMIETIINYHPEYLVDAHGSRLRYRYDAAAVGPFLSIEGEEVLAPDGEPYQVRGTFPRDADGALIPDDGGMPFRIWRRPLDPDLNDGRAAWPGITSPADIWDEIVSAGEVPGTTSAPVLQPIAARIVMLQSGMRAPMGIKVKGPDLATLDAFGLRLEELVKQVPGVKAEAVIADRIVGKPYLEIDLDREAIARYGVPIENVQRMIEIAIGGQVATTTVEGRERYPVRVRYQRELRDSIEAIERMLVPGQQGQQIPLAQVAEIRYTRGPQMIKSEDTLLVGYVLFDKRAGYAEVEVVEAVAAHLKRLVAEEELVVPKGVSWEFAGNYQNQLRAARTLLIVLPLSLVIIFVLLYLHFRSVLTTLIVFSGIAVAWSGGFLLLWLYAQEWFLHWDLFGVDLRALFQIGPMNLSVAVWVGFLALFGIATDDGVVMATYLKQSVGELPTESVAQIRDATVAGALRRLRPCLMTTATTLLALLPVLTSTGRGSDIMVPMAIPSFGGMLIALLTMFIVPVLYCATQEARLRVANRREAAPTHAPQKESDRV